MPSPRAQSRPFPARELDPKEQHRGQKGLGTHGVREAAAAHGGWQKGGAGRGEKHLFLQRLFYSRPLQLGQLPLGTGGFFVGAGFIHPAYL